VGLRNDVIKDDIKTVRLYDCAADKKHDEKRIVIMSKQLKQADF